jgi:uncharacterized protein DUF5302
VGAANACRPGAALPGAGQPAIAAARYGSRVTEAKDDTKAPAAAAEPVPPGAAEADPDSAETAAAVETDPRKRFKAALDRKNATPGTHPGSQAEGSNDLKSSNGKRQRQFRRKSGG